MRFLVAETEKGMEEPLEKTQLNLPNLSALHSKVDK